MIKILRNTHSGDSNISYVYYGSSNPFDIQVIFHNGPCDEYIAENEYGKTEFFPMKGPGDEEYTIEEIMLNKKFAAKFGIKL